MGALLPRARRLCRGRRRLPAGHRATAQRRARRTATSATRCCAWADRAEARGAYRARPNWPRPRGASTPPTRRTWRRWRSTCRRPATAPRPASASTRHSRRAPSTRRSGPRRPVHALAGRTDAALAALARALELGYSRADAAKRPTNSRPCARMPGSRPSCGPDEGPPVQVAPRLVYRAELAFPTGSFDMCARARVRYATIFVLPSAAKGARARVSTTPETLDGPRRRHRRLDRGERHGRRLARQGVDQVEGQEPAQGRTRRTFERTARGAVREKAKPGDLQLQHPHRRRRGVRPRTRDDELKNGPVGRLPRLTRRRGPALR